MATKKVILKEIVDDVAGDSLYPQTSIDQVEGLENALAAAGSVSTISVNGGTPLEPDASKNINISVPEGTITGITMNGVSKGTSGVVDLGTVITAHQDISGKQDTIDDLSTIRSGATAGSTAIQSITVGTTTTGAAGSSASVTNTGTATEPVLSFTIPQGAQGIQGIQGPQGERGPQGNTGVQVDSVASIIHSIDSTTTYAADDVAGADAVQDVLAEVTELAGEVWMIETMEDGFYVVDEQLNIGFAVDSNGAHAINLMEYEIVNI